MNWKTAKDLPASFFPNFAIGNTKYVNTKIAFQHDLLAGKMISASVLQFIKEL